MKTGLFLKCLTLLGFAFSLTNDNVIFAQINTQTPEPPAGYKQLAHDINEKDAKKGVLPFYNVNTQVNIDVGNVINDFVPVVAVHKDTVYMAWSVPASGDIYFSRSTDGGLTFSAALKINDAVNYPPSFSVWARSSY